MVTVGIDVGAKNIKIIVLNDKEIKAKGKAYTGFEALANAKNLYNQVLSEAGVTHDQIDYITSTGAGRREIDFDNHKITDVTASSRGVYALHPNVRTVIDVGSEEGRGIRCDDNGKIVDFAVNEKCAAGSGAFTEAMARALEIPIEEFGPISLQSDKQIPMNAQCAVFAESEVVSLLHAKTEKKDIAKAINDAIASRITSMVRKVGFEKDVAVIGGVAYNVGFIRAVSEDFETDLLVPEFPEYISAYGAAITRKQD